VLVAIAILALLAGLLLPALQLARSLARTSACRSNLQQLGAVTMIYAEANYEVAPGSRAWGANDPARSIAWYHRLPRELGQDKVPSGPSIFQCPDFQPGGRQVFGHDIPKSYKMNAAIDSDRGRYVPFLLGGVRDAASLVLFVDATTAPGMGQWGHAPASAVDDTRHGRRVNILFADGHSIGVAASPRPRTWSEALKWKSEEWTGR
jgi:prepilin-type processing-associated H-X9-DG protein